MAYNPDVIDSGECTPSEVMAGFPTRIAFIRDCDVTEVPVRKETVETAADKCAMTGQFVFKAGKRPIFIDSIDQTVHYAAAIQGETGSKSFAPTAEFATKDKVEADAFSAECLNRPGYLIIQEFDGRQLMVGNKLLKATIDPSFDSGTAMTDPRRYSFAATVAGSFRAKQYLVTPLNMDFSGEDTYVPYS